MKYLVFLALAVLCIAAKPAQAAAFNGPLRQHIVFNRDWRFQLGDFNGAQAPRYDDAEWRQIGLPHSFSIPYFGSSAFYTGYGWYRKHFDVPAHWSGKRVSIEFEAAFQDAEVFVDGRRIGEHKGGYTGFNFDITNAIKPGDNVVAVRLNNVWNARLAPRAGEHVFSGGLYRDVYLNVTDPLHVAWYGTCVTTHGLSAASGVVNIKTEVRNDSDRAKVCRVETKIVDPGGRTVATVTSALDVPASAAATFDQTTPAISDPALWSPEHPNLYTAVTRLYDGKRESDDYTTTFGMRWFQWTADQGFFLNGKHLYFHGADVHQDQAGWGDAVTDAAAARDVKMIKDAGFNFIRGSHYPHSPAFVAACDRMGVLFWSENCFWGIGGGHHEGYWSASAYPPNDADQPGFEASVEDSLRDMIRIDRNSPSIIAWSMCNEVFFSDPSVMDKTRDFLRRLVALTHQLDPTRRAAIGGAQRGEIDKIGDIAGYNGDGARLYINPGIPSAVTEYGSVVANRPGIYAPNYGDIAGQPEFAWRSGQAIWCGFDHGSIAGGGFGDMGLIDYFRLPKRAWYWYRNAYANIPPPQWPQPGSAAKLRLTTDKTNLSAPDGTDDAQLIVTVLDASGQPISDSPPVTFTIESGPGEFPTGRSITFAPGSDIGIRDGQAAISFRSYYAGRSVIRASSPGLESAAITIETEGAPVFVAGKTPLASDRPYVRFTKAMQPSVDTNLAVNRPTFAGSEAADHSARLANDGDLNTFWAASDDKTGVWWEVDLENFYKLSEIKTTFATNGEYQYRIEASKDQKQWVTVADQTAMVSTERSRTDACPPSTAARFVRITLTRLPLNGRAALSEVEVIGR